MTFKTLRRIAIFYRYLGVTILVLGNVSALPPILETTRPFDFAAFIFTVLATTIGGTMLMAMGELSLVCIGIYDNTRNRSQRRPPQMK